MAGLGWISVAIAALPHITDLVKASKELLKNRKPASPTTLDAIDANDPISSVAAACQNNAAAIELLTEQMQSQLEHYQEGIIRLQKRLRRMTILSVLALGFAAFALYRSLNP